MLSKFSSNYFNLFFFQKLKSSKFVRYFFASIYLFLLQIVPLQAQDFLPPELAFPVKISPKDSQTLQIEFNPQPGYYLYRDKFKFALVSPSEFTLGAAVFPKGEIKDDPTFGKTEIYHQTVSITLPVSRNNPSATNFKLEVTSQGCAEAGICYPPDIRIIEVNLPTQTLSTPATQRTTANSEQNNIDDTESILQKMRSGSFITTLLLFFVFGLGLALTPCVYPLTPILLSILVGQGQQSSLRRGFFISFVYVQGMAFTFAIAGVIAAFIGSLLSNLLQNPWVLGVASLIMVIFAFAMFGFFTIQLPASWQNNLNNKSEELNRSYLLTIFIMGVLSALVIGPCVAPPLFAALLYISQSNDVWLGGMSLFMLAQGMGVPLLIAGASAGKLLPKAGAWMDKIKVTFGFLLLALAIWTVQAFLSKNILLILSALILIFAAIYLNLFAPQAEKTNGWDKFQRGIAVILMFIGLYLLSLPLANIFHPTNNLINQPIVSESNSAKMQNNSATSHNQDGFVAINNLQDLQQKLELAKSNNQPVLVDFYADWCVSCIEMEKLTFSDRQIQKEMDKFVKLRIDLTNNSDEGRELLKKYQLFGPPAIIFYNQQGEQSKIKVIGFKSTEQFLSILQQIK